jgi:hypothetical protein
MPFPINLVRSLVLLFNSLADFTMDPFGIINLPIFSYYGVATIISENTCPAILLRLMSNRFE